MSRLLEGRGIMPASDHAGRLTDSGYLSSGQLVRLSPPPFPSAAPLVPPCAPVPSTFKPLSSPLRFILTLPIGYTGYSTLWGQGPHLIPSAFPAPSTQQGTSRLCDKSELGTLWAIEGGNTPSGHYTSSLISHTYPWPFRSPIRSI